MPSLATPPENAAARSIRKFGLADGCEKEFIEIYLYETAAGRPTCRQYAELNYAPIAIGDALCRQRCNLVRAYLRLTEIGRARATGNQQSVRENEKLYRELLHSDIGVQEQFAELLAGFSKMQPCYTRTSFMDKEIATLLAGTKDKISKLRVYLAANESRSAN